MQRSMGICLPETLDHLRFLSRHVGGNISGVVVAVLLELNIPSSCLGFAYLLLAIEQFCQDPFSITINGIFSKMVQTLDGKVTEAQIEQAIRRAIQKGWKNSELAPWKRYFSTTESGIMRTPTSREFICRIGYLVMLGMGNKERIGHHEQR